MTCCRWLAFAACAAALCITGCATTKKDVTGTGDDRLDESAKGDPEAQSSSQQKASCETGTGDLELLDARTGEPVTCTQVTLLRDGPNCEEGAECPQEQVMRGRTTHSGHLKLTDPALLRTRLTAVAEGYQQSRREPTEEKAGTIGELELIPSDGFLLKFVDADGNYLPGVTVAFKQGGETIAQMKTNELANVWFPARTPFAGEPVTVEAEGYSAVTVNGPSDLGDDGHTVTLRR